MDKLKTIEILKDFNESIVHKLVNKLNYDGIVSDEDECGLSSSMIENWGSDCDSFLKDKGYLGGKMLRHGKYFSSHGAVYTLFDSDIHDSDSTEYYMGLHVKNHKK